MPHSVDPRIVVTPRSVRRFWSDMAAGGTDPAARLGAAIETVTPSRAEQAALLAAFSDARAHLEALGGEAGDYMDSPGDRNASLLQSVIAEHCEGRALGELASGGVEAQFDPVGAATWLAAFWNAIKQRAAGLHPWVAPPAAPEAMPERARIALVGDWGTGMYGAPAVARCVEGDPEGFSHLVHLGDVYYSGTHAECRGRFLSTWPNVHGAVSRACNGNHEMNSGGWGYFDGILPAFGQAASAFAFQNAGWLVVGLDTAYVDHDLGVDQAEWLTAIVEGAGARRVIVLSHHQPYSRLSAQGPKLVAAMGELLGGGRLFAWYWAHEHRCVVYERHPSWGTFGRCLGHGGMTEPRAKLARFPRVAGLGGSSWRALDGAPGVPKALALDGPNLHAGGEGDRFLANGYGVLALDGARLTEKLYGADGVLLYESRLA